MLNGLNRRVKSVLTDQEIADANKAAPAWVSDAISVSVADKRRKGNDRLSMAALGSRNLHQEIKSKQEKATGKVMHLSHPLLYTPRSTCCLIDSFATLHTQDANSKKIFS